MSHLPPPSHLPNNDIEKNNNINNHIDSSSDGNGSPYHLDSHDNSDTGLRKIKTAGSISITPETFESLFLSPKNRVANDLRATFANPTPLGLVGFLLSTTPLANALLGWRGASDGGAAEVGVYYFFGGVLSILGAILEFVLGNTFPFVVFGSFGGFWLTLGATLTPFYSASPTHSTSDPTFAASFGFLQLYMGLLCLVFTVCAIRTNVIFVGLFLMLMLTFACLAGMDWHTAQGHADLALKCQRGAGGVAFVACLLGWYLLLVQLLASVDFPVVLPVGDLSRVVKGKSDRKTDRKGDDARADENEGKVKHNGRSRLQSLKENCMRGAEKLAVVW